MHCWYEQIFCHSIEYCGLFLGSSTACIVALHREKSILHAANLGDSGFVVIRKNAIVHRSQEQQHYFNSPFQLAIHPNIKEPGLIADRYLFEHKLDL